VCNACWLSCRLPLHALHSPVLPRSCRHACSLSTLRQQDFSKPTLHPVRIHSNLCTAFVSTEIPCGLAGAFQGMRTCRQCIRGCNGAQGPLQDQPLADWRCSLAIRWRHLRISLPGAGRHTAQVLCRVHCCHCCSLLINPARLCRMQACCVFVPAA
jgi:hypothetical protein